MTTFDIEEDGRHLSRRLIVSSEGNGYVGSTVRGQDHDFEWHWVNLDCAPSRELLVAYRGEAVREQTSESTAVLVSKELRKAVRELLRIKGPAGEVIARLVENGNIDNSDAKTLRALLRETAKLEI